MTTEAGPDTREPETEAGRQMCSDLDDWEGWDPGIVNQVLAIEAEIRAKLAAEVAGLRRIHRSGTGRRGDEREYLDYSEVTRLLRGDPGGAA